MSIFNSLKRTNNGSVKINSIKKNNLTPKGIMPGELILKHKTGAKISKVIRELCLENYFEKAGVRSEPLFKNLITKQKPIFPNLEKYSF